MARTTVRQDKEFLKDELFPSIPENLLELAAEYLNSHVNPGDVFDEDQLADWALAHGFVKTED